MVETLFLSKGVETMGEIRRKRVRISSQRQFTIPKEFYEALNLKDEAIIEYDGKHLTIKPSDDEVVDFSEYILADLISQGVSGDELLQKFKEIKSNIPDALEKMKASTMQQPEITGNLDDYLDSLEDTVEDD